MLKIHTTLLLLIMSITLISCTDAIVAAKGGKKVIFDSDELEMKIVYVCSEDPELEAFDARTQKAHDYFTVQNKALTDQMMERIKKDEDNMITTMYQFNKDIEQLGADLEEKFACTAIDTIDYPEKEKEEE